MSDTAPNLPAGEAGLVARWWKLSLALSILSLLWISPLLAAAIWPQESRTSPHYANWSFCDLSVGLAALGAFWVIVGPGWIWFRAATAICLWPALVWLFGVAWNQFLGAGARGWLDDLGFFASTGIVQFVSMLACVGVMQALGCDWFGFRWMGTAPQFGLRHLLALTACAALLSLVATQVAGREPFSIGWLNRWQWFATHAGSNLLISLLALGAADTRIPWWLGIPTGAVLTAVVGHFTGVLVQSLGTSGEYSCALFVVMSLLQFAFVLCGSIAVRAVLQAWYGPEEPAPVHDQGVAPGARLDHASPGGVSAAS